MNDKKIYLGELECYENATEKEKENPLMAPNRYFDLNRLPDTAVRNEMEEFIRYRGRVLTPLSIRSDLYPFNLMSQFLTDRYPNISSFAGLDLDEAEKSCKVWLVQKGKNITQKRHRTETGKVEVMDSDVIRYLRKVVLFFNKEDEHFNFDSDTWHLQDIPISLRTNPTRRIKTIHFTKIPQRQIRQEIKSIIYIHLTEKALGTVLGEMTAVNRFTVFLANKCPEVDSLQKLDRTMIEEYLAYTNIEAAGRKSYSKELYCLKAVIQTAGSILEDEQLGNLFYADDIGSDPSCVYKVYSDAELKRLNEALMDMDAQVARALILHQLLGTRISETLTLRQNALKKGETGKWVIRIDQVKQRSSFEKAVSEEIKVLFERACRYTNDKFGKQEFVFVNEKEPELPMSYGRIQYQLMAVIEKKDLRDDHGEKFTVGTHTFRHVYGQKLMELGVEDATIARLLGHKGLGSVQSYRHIENQTMAAETSRMREHMDDTIKELIKEWYDTEEQGYGKTRNDDPGK